MHAEVVAIGDELTSGQRLDTNTQWLSQKLEELGIQVKYHTTVGDELQAMTEVVRIAAARSEIVVSSGGLGPTADDLTRNGLAEAAGVELTLDPHMLDHIKQLYARRNRQMPPRNAVQAELPGGALWIPNRHGTAPGIHIPIGNHRDRPCQWYAVPGVPEEMREMWNDTVYQSILTQLGDDRTTIRHYRLKCFGVGESDLEQMLPGLTERGRQPSVGITVSRATITLRVTVRGAHGDACFEKMQPTIATIRDCLGDLIFGEEDQELPDVVIEMLARNHLTLSTAEIATPGLLTSWLEHHAQAAGALLGHQLIASENDALVWTSDSATDKSGRQLAESVASACRSRYGSDLALTIGAAASAADPDAPPLHIALASPERVISVKTHLGGHPDVVHHRVAKQALNLVRKWMLKRYQSA